METNLQKSLKQISYRPDCRLSEDIWNEVLRKSNKVAKWKTFIYLCVGALSLSGSIFSVKSLVEQFSRLGFFDYFSLIFSDGGIVATYWKDYTLTLVDSFPIATLGVSLFLLFAMFVSVRKASHFIKGRMLTA